MNEVRDDLAMLLEEHQHTCISIGAKDLFILDGRDSVNDLIYAWTHFVKLPLNSPLPLKSTKLNLTNLRDE